MNLIFYDHCHFTKFGKKLANCSKALLEYAEKDGDNMYTRKFFNRSRLIDKGTPDYHFLLVWDHKQIQQTYFCSFLLSCVTGNAVIEAYPMPVSYFWVRKPGVLWFGEKTSRFLLLTRNLKVGQSCRISGLQRVHEMHGCSKTKRRTFCCRQGNFHCLDLSLCIEVAEGLFDMVTWRVISLKISFECLCCTRTQIRNITIIYPAVTDYLWLCSIKQILWLVMLSHWSRTRARSGYSILLT